MSYGRFVTGRVSYHRHSKQWTETSNEHLVYLLTYACMYPYSVYMCILYHNIVCDLIILISKWFVITKCQTEVNMECETERNIDSMKNGIPLNTTRRTHGVPARTLRRLRDNLVKFSGVVNTVLPPNVENMRSTSRILLRNCRNFLNDLKTYSSEVSLL